MGDSTLNYVKDAVDGLNRTFGEYKTVNDRRLDELEKRGASDPLDDDQLKRINAALDEFEEVKTAAEGAKKVSEERHKEVLKAQDELKAEYKERMDAIEVAVKRAPRGGSDDKNQEVNEARQMFGQFARQTPADMDEEVRRRLLEAKALSLGDNTQSGYLAPPEYVREMIKAEIEMSPMRSLARVSSTGRTSIQIPKRTGTFTAVWVAERATRSETEGLTYGLEELPSHELYALVDVSEQNLEDSLFDLENELEMEFTEQFAVAEGLAFITGNGAGKPEGVLDNSEIQSTNSGSAATIADANGQANGLIELQHALKTAYARNASWILNRPTLGNVRQLKDGQNQYIWAAGAAVGDPNRILGDPYMEMPDMPNQAANATPIAYGDWRRTYRILDRISMAVLRDPFTQATSGAIRFIARRRVGGQVVLAEAARKLKCAA